MKLTKSITRNIVFAAALAALLLTALFGNGSLSLAQQTFVGDYDKTFAAPLGYYVDPEDVDPTVEDYQTLFNTGEPLPDGSINVVDYRFPRLL